MGDLSEEEKRKLEEMISTWDDIHRAARFLSWIGKKLGWIVSIAGGFALCWSAWHGK
jgi:hypothetical protein